MGLDPSLRWDDSWEEVTAWAWPTLRKDDILLLGVGSFGFAGLLGVAVRVWIPAFAGMTVWGVGQVLFDPFRVGGGFWCVVVTPGFALLRPGLPLFYPFGVGCMKVAAGQGVDGWEL